MSNLYQDNGFENRMEYLKSISEDYGVPMEVVLATADIYGENEDFDGLVTTIEDYSQGVYG